MAFGIKTLLAKEAGRMTIVLTSYCFVLVPKYLGLNQDGGVILES
jgi:hypothetical protein